MLLISLTGLSQNKKAVKFFNIGEDLFNKGDYSNAIVSYSYAIEKYPKYYEALNNRGNSYANMGKFKKALTDYNNAIEIDPKNTDAYYNRGYCYRKMGKNELALKNFNIVLKKIK